MPDMLQTVPAIFPDPSEKFTICGSSSFVLLLQGSMSGSSKSAPGSQPLWQRSDSPVEEPKAGVADDLATGDYPKTDKAQVSLQDQATKFLDNDEIRAAPIERKIQFLQKKGLSDDEIRSLLRSLSKKDSNATDGTNGKIEDGQTSGTDVECSSAVPQETPDTEAASTTVSSLYDRDAPPIITYPEFLLHSQKPPPLITAQRLITAAYTVSGAAALIYGTSKYIVEPMIESLATARHSFAESAIHNILGLNEKLEGVVSVLPNALHSTPDLLNDQLDDVEASSFFHRSAATQTSPRLSRSNSVSSSNSLTLPSTIEAQAAKLERVREDLQALLEPSGSDLRSTTAGVQRDMKTEIDSLRTYLNHLTYGGAHAIDNGQKKEDGLTKLKGEIRQAKGVLLSSRNFPSTTAARGWGTAAVT